MVNNFIRKSHVTTCIGIAFQPSSFVSQGYKNNFQLKALFTVSPTELLASLLKMHTDEIVGLPTRSKHFMSIQIIKQL